MKAEVKTGYNRAFRWTETQNIRFIGYLADEETLFPEKTAIRDLFSSCQDFSAFVRIVSKLNGVFSIILRQDDEVYAASDPSRFFPLFYHLKGDELFLSDDIDFVRSASGKRDLDPLAVTEYLAAAFTCDHRTLFRDVCQITSSEAVCFSGGKAERRSFYSMAGQSIPEGSRITANWITAAKESIDRAFEKILMPLKDKPVLLPLSGGIDSRLIACKLKELGFKKVVCLTYGKPTHEVRLSERVAKILEFPWYFVEYTEELTSGFRDDIHFEEYAHYAARGNSMFYLQEYPAIKWLLDQGIISDDYIVLPGHPGDLVRGSLILSPVSNPKATKKLPAKLIRKKFIHHRLSSSEKKELREALKKKINQLSRQGVKTFSVQEDWELKERTSKYIINSSHAFTFFNLPCYFPLAERELMNFFRDLPLPLRYHGKLYYETLNQHYFQPGGLDFRDDIQPSIRKLMLNNIKKRVRPLLPFPVKQKLLVKNDWVAYGPMTALLLEELNENKVYPKETGSSYLYRILHWYLWKIDR